MNLAPGDSTSIASPPARSYSTEEWEEKRPFITQLYRHKGRALDHVRSVLTQQLFRPT